MKIAETTLGKKKINNSYDFKLIHNNLCWVNETEGTGLEGKLTEIIDKICKRHMTVNRTWRYDVEKRDFRSL